MEILPREHSKEQESSADDISHHYYTRAERTTDDILISYVTRVAFRVDLCRNNVTPNSKDLIG